MLKFSISFTPALIAVVLLAAAGSFTSNIASAATLVGYWQLDGDGTATVGTNGTLVATSGSPTSTTDRNGVAGGALFFQGSGEQYVSIAGGGGLSGASVGTISLWANWTTTQDSGCCGGGFGPVLARQANGVFSNVIFSLDNADPALAHVRTSSNGIGPTITGGTIVGDGIWHNVVLAFDGTSQELYLDGVSQGTTGAVTFTSNSTPLTIGAWNGDGAGYSTSSIDDTGIFAEKLDLAEIKSIYSLSTAGGFQYDLQEANQLFDLYSAGSGEVIIDGITWQNTTGLSGGLGVVQALPGGFYALQLAVDGTGLLANPPPAPEPTSALLLFGLLLPLAKLRRTSAAGRK